MPKTKLQETMAGADWSEFEKKIKIMMIRADVNSLEAIAKTIGCSGPALRGWVRNPLTMRIDALLHLMAALKAEPEDVHELTEILKRGLMQEHMAY